jgi:hypothetical protein
MAQTVVRDGPFRLFFFSREEPGMHIHVAHPHGEAKFWLELGVALATHTGMSERELAEAERVVARHHSEISMPGTNTSVAEVTHVSVSKNGFWLLLGDEELLVPFVEFPWFRQATIEQLTTIEWPDQDHLYWPLLDVDLSVESIRHPEKFPLVSAISANTSLQGDAPQAARPCA